MNYPYIKLGPCLKAAKILRERIFDYEKKKGIGPGTFFLDAEAVDKYIIEMKKELEYLDQRAELIRKNKDNGTVKTNEEMIIELRKSEIF